MVPPLFHLFSYIHHIIDRELGQHRNNIATEKDPTVIFSLIKRLRLFKFSFPLTFKLRLFFLRHLLQWSTSRIAAIPMIDPPSAAGGRRSTTSDCVC